MLNQGVSIDGNGEIVVFLHSSLSSSKQWRSLAQTLSRSFTCINIDLLGYGEAPSVEHPSSFTFNTEIERIKTIINQVSEGSKYHLIGHSCGGAIALKMAVENPESILSLSLYEPVSFHLYDSLPVSKISDIGKQIKGFAEQMASLDRSQATQKFFDFWNGEGAFHIMPDKVKQAMINDIDKVHLDFKGIFHEKYTCEGISKISSPCLVLYGQYSPEISIQLSQNIIKELKDVQAVEVASAHMGPISHPHLIEPAIKQFILDV